MSQQVTPFGSIRGEEHWVQKGDVRLFLFEKYAGDPSGPAGAGAAGTILFVHGSSMASQPTFDLHVPGRPDSSVMDWFAARGFDCWCVDMEGYGRSTKDRDNNAPIAQGADDCFAAASYIGKLRGQRPLLVYGISSGALRAALFAERHPDMVKRLALDAMVWTGAGSPTLAERRKRLPEFRSKNRRPNGSCSVKGSSAAPSASRLQHSSSSSAPIMDGLSIIFIRRRAIWICAVTKGCELWSRVRKVWTSAGAIPRCLRSSASR